MILVLMRGIEMLCCDWNVRAENGDRKDYSVCDDYVDFIDDELFSSDTPFGSN